MVLTLKKGADYFVRTYIDIFPGWLEVFSLFMLRSSQFGYFETKLANLDHRYTKTFATLILAILTIYFSMSIQLANVRNKLLHYCNMYSTIFY